MIIGYKNSNGELVSQPLNPGLDLQLTENERALAAALAQKLSKIGLNIEVDGTRVVATSIPLCIYNHFTKVVRGTFHHNHINYLTSKVHLHSSITIKYWSVYSLANGIDCWSWISVWRYIVQFNFSLNIIAKYFKTVVLKLIININGWDLI